VRYPDDDGVKCWFVRLMLSASRRHAILWITATTINTLSPSIHPSSPMHLLCNVRRRVDVAPALYYWLFDRCPCWCWHLHAKPQLARRTVARRGLRFTPASGPLSCEVKLLNIKSGHKFTCKFLFTTISFSSMIRKCNLSSNNKSFIIPAGVLFIVLFADVVQVVMYGCWVPSGSRAWLPHYRWLILSIDTAHMYCTTKYIYCLPCRSPNVK